MVTCLWEHFLTPLSLVSPCGKEKGKEDTGIRLRGTAWPVLPQGGIGIVKEKPGMGTF